EVTPDPGLDRGYGESSIGTVPAPGQDPALETDQTKIATEFPTKFGTSEPEASPAPENVDAEFEARVAAAMSGYDTSTDSVEIVETSSVEDVPPTPEKAEVAASAAGAPGSTPDYEDTQKIEAPVEVAVV